MFIKETTKVNKTYIENRTITAISEVKNFSLLITFLINNIPKKAAINIVNRDVGINEILSTLLNGYNRKISPIDFFLLRKIKKRRLTAKKSKPNIRIFL